jgi:hypothetical protein
VRPLWKVGALSGRPVDQPAAPMGAGSGHPLMEMIAGNDAPVVA